MALIIKRDERGCGPAEVIQVHERNTFHPHTTPPPEIIIASNEKYRVFINGYSPLMKDFIQMTIDHYIDEDLRHVLHELGNVIKMSTVDIIVQYMQSSSQRHHLVPETPDDAFGRRTKVDNDTHHGYHRWWTVGVARLDSAGKMSAELGMLWNNTKLRDYVIDQLDSPDLFDRLTLGRFIDGHHVHGFKIPAIQNFMHPIDEGFPQDYIPH